MLLALALKLDPVYVGAHHLSRWLSDSSTLFRSVAADGARALRRRGGAGADRAGVGARRSDLAAIAREGRGQACDGPYRRVQDYSAASARLPCSGRPSRSQTSTSASAKHVDQRVLVIRRRRDAQPLGALRHGRIVDRLDVDAVLVEQQVGRRLALLRIADEHRHDMGVVRHHRQAGGDQHRLGARGAILVALALEARGLEVADRGRRGGADRRRQRGGEDEARRIAAHRVDQRRHCRRCSRRGSRTPWRACPRSRRRGPSRPAARPGRRRAGRTCRPRAPRRHRSWRRSARRGRRCALIGATSPSIE